MDLIQIWNQAVNNIVESSEDEKDKTIIQLFCAQVNLLFDGSKITFLCSSKYIYKLFKQYSDTFLDEICNLLGRQDVGFSIEVVAPGRADSFIQDSQGLQNTTNDISAKNIQAPSLDPSHQQTQMQQPQVQQSQVQQRPASNNGYQSVMPSFSQSFTQSYGGSFVQSQDFAQFGGFFNSFAPMGCMQQPPAPQVQRPAPSSLDINSALPPLAPAQSMSNNDLMSSTPSFEVSSPALPKEITDIIENKINYEKTFNNYITDPDNKMLHLTALKVAENPGNNMYNPFYVYGGSGLGKTHLLFAIANELRRKQPGLKVLYTRAEHFLRCYVNFLSGMHKQRFTKHNLNFQDAYTSYDVFIVDDVQGFTSSEQTRNIFFDIISEFVDKPGRQLILASDVAPGNLTGFSPRLTTRFGSGICIEVLAPCLETRAAIVTAKCHELRIHLPDDVVDYITKNIKTNVRHIEGTIKTAGTYIESNGSITPQQLTDIINDQVGVENMTLSIGAIKIRVAQEFDIKVEAMESADRRRTVSQARSIAMSLIRDLIPTTSLSVIGRAFNKDHSSVHEAIRRIHTKISTDPDMATQYHRLEMSLKKD